MSTISRRDPDQPRTLLGTMLMPRWIALLVLALVIAAAFAALGKWQLERAYRAAPTQQSAPTESVKPLTETVETGSLLRTERVGQIVSAEGEFVPGDYLVVTNRMNEGTSGYWVAGHLVTKQGNALAVGLGWTESRQTADAVAERLNAEQRSGASITGRVLPAQFPELDEDAPHDISTMAPAWFVNEWQEMDGVDVYEAYVVADSAPTGLETINAPPPEQEVEINWLNIFYAIEWVVFAGFAVFLWFRIVKDGWERDLEERELAEADTGAPSEKVN
ncbi:SURF1 family cytochrome oxidase biogenesis protein [Paramicrobacterium chengjingii]|uniref:SURF1-like protein n=1 Tax=Paramicrobacterium chengjingii TaxID=2769067 RepID=A0ABX6YK85_9MICO|nr:SURF1 family cytochrome oxidase biogenesis protein [Microbacterium chengjingii]QPZ39202.1 SURF1 family protein [Microbacterium chengjingii]